MLGFQSQKYEMMRLGISESDFHPIMEAVAGAFEKHDVPGMEADLMFKYADKNHDGYITEEEYIAWTLDEDENAARKAELAKLMEPVYEAMQADVMVAVTQLLLKIMR